MRSPEPSNGDSGIDKKTILGYLSDNLGSLAWSGGGFSLGVRVSYCFCVLKSFVVFVLWGAWLSSPAEVER